MNFILNIGSRQSGKTERLINYLVDRVKCKKYSLVIVCSERNIKGIKDRINKKIKSKILREYFDVVCYSNISNVKNKKLLDVNISMFFYDEFDFYINQISPEWLTVKGYYCTTPLLKSIKKCTTDLLEKIM